jgi:hypothetical protein
MGRRGGFVIYFGLFAMLAFSGYVIAYRHIGLGFFDASEYSSHIAGDGIAHAPGYPLYTLVGKALNLFLGNPFAAQFWMGWLSAIGSALIFTYTSALRL